MLKIYSTPPGRVALVLLLAFFSSPLFAQVSITHPINRIVLQRNGKNEARIAITGRVSQAADRIEARLEVVNGGQAMDWQTIDQTLDNGNFVGSLTAKGGWYKLLVRAVKNNSPVGSVSTVERVGVGEVFLIVGHSNAQGGATPALEPASPSARERVISIDPSRNRDRFKQYDKTGNPDFLAEMEFTELCAKCGMAPYLLDDSWFWGRLGERLVARLNVPVLFYSAAFGGTSMQQTYKAAYDIPFSHSFVNYSNRMPYRNIQNALKYYVPKTGLRAILSGHGVNDRGASREDFRFWYEKVIEKTRQDTENPDLTWAVATSAFIGEVQQTITDAQNDLIGRPNVHRGGNLNLIGNDGRTDRVHFNQAGQELAARYWNESLNDAFFALSKPHLARTPALPEAVQVPETNTPAPPVECNTSTYLSDTQWSSVNGWGPVERDRSNGEDRGGDGRNLRIRGEEFSKGLGVHAASEITYSLGGNWTRFKAAIGVDDEVGVSSRASVVFEVYADGQRIYQSGTLRRNSSLVNLNLDITGKQQLKLVVTNAGDGADSDHADWANARVERICGTQPPAPDTQAPTASGKPTVSNLTQTSLTLNWTASTDNVGVTGYEVYRGTVLIGTVNTTTMNVSGLTEGTAYAFSIKAKDAAGNVSTASETLNVTTQSAPAPPTNNAGSTPPITNAPSTEGCQPTTTFLSDMNWVGTPVNGWGPVEKNRSNNERAGGDGNPIRINGTTYAKGLGVHAASEIVYNLGGNWTRFKAAIGIDDEVNSASASVVFEVWADGQRIYQSGTLRDNSATVQVDVNVTGKQQLKLVVTDAGNGAGSDHADWADARLERACGTPPVVTDTQAPTQPSNLVANNLTQNSVTLTWAASTDNVGVTGYEVYRGADKIADCTTTSHTVTGIAPNTTSGYSVKARDAAGNVSPGCPLLQVTTLAAPSTPSGCQPTTTFLSDMNWVGTPVNGWGPVEKDRSNNTWKAGDGKELRLNGKAYAKGLGVHAGSEIVYNLGGTWTRFKAEVGIHDEITSASASVVFEVWADGQRIYQSGVFKHDSPTGQIDLDVTGKQQLKLVVDGGKGTDSDHANWADAKLIRACSQNAGQLTQTGPISHRTRAEPAPDPERISAELKSGVVRLSPNPAQESTVIECQSVYLGTTTVEVISLFGQVMQREVVEKTAPVLRHPLSVRGLTSGLYLVKIRMGNQVLTGRVQVIP